MRAKLCIALALLAAGGGVARAQQAVSVILDPSTRYQTILGWGKTTPWLPAPQLLRDQCIDRAVNDLGINRLRFEGLCGNSTRRRSWEWLNDNADPYVIDWPGFNTAAVDAVADEWLKPWKRAVEARGEKLNLYVSPSFFQGGSSGDLPPWMRANPQEYAEWAVALLTRLRDAHGITADYYCICNEAGNNNAFDPPRVARAISALMPRLRQLGFPTTVQFPESVNAQVAWRYVEALRDDPEVWKWIGLISYHWYGQDNQSAMAKLRDFAFRAGLPTAQTEFMDLTIDHLYDDMVIGGVSYWEIYGLASPDYKAALSHVSSKTFHAGPWYWRFRQVSHYVRPGAVRIGCASSDPVLRCLAFGHQGHATVVLINTTPPHTSRAVVLRGLPAGTYGVSQCVGQEPYKELGLRTVAGDGLLSVEVAANSVLTVYPHGPGNGPPTVVEWRSAPDFLSAPASSVQLSCLATDPEADGLSYKWSVVGQPQGAQVALSTPSGASVRAAGLTQPGDYLFAAEVSDGTHAVARQVLVKVFGENQPPVPTDVHNRIPVWVTVRNAGTLLRAAAWDVEGDPVTFRWEVLAAPPGASPTLETPDKPACRAAGMTVPGDYVFRVCLSDPTHTGCTDHTVPVYP